MKDASIARDEITALLVLVPPASRLDRPGELFIGAFERLVGKERVTLLIKSGFVEVGLPPSAVPGRVLSFYEEFCSRDTLQRSPVSVACYASVATLTEAGWAAILQAIDAGLCSFTPPVWYSERESEKQRSERAARNVARAQEICALLNRRVFHIPEGVTMEPWEYDARANDSDAECIVISTELCAYDDAHGCVAKERVTFFCDKPMPPIYCDAEIESAEELARSAEHAVLDGLFALRVKR